VNDVKPMESEAEKRAYSRGYAAGRKRLEGDLIREAIKSEERDFWERAVLQVATHFMECEGWTQGEKKLTSLDDRASLAVKFADFVVAARRRR